MQCLLSLGATEIRLGQLLPGLLRVGWIKQMVVVKDLQEWWVLGRRDTEDTLGNSGAGAGGWFCLSGQKCPKTSRWSWDMKEEEETVAGSTGHVSGRWWERAETQLSWERAAPAGNGTTYWRCFFNGCFKRDKTIKWISNSLISFPGLGDKNNNEVGQFHIHRLWATVLAGKEAAVENELEPHPSLWKSWTDPD